MRARRCAVCGGILVERIGLLLHADMLRWAENPHDAVLPEDDAVESVGNEQ